jgi:hypothetical protein
MTQPRTLAERRGPEGWIAVTGALILAASFAAPAFPLTQEGAAEAQAPEEEPVKNDAAVEEILRQQEALLRGQQFSYDAENRRDPFRSLYETVKPRGAGPRPPGVAGMLVTEIDLAGIVRDDTTGDVAYFVGSDNKGYFLRVGERVYDATLISIDGEKGAVTFRQEVDDPRQIQPYRDVVRTLVPADEESNP